MTVYAGIDEAGLGPTLGPFTVGVVAFAVPEPFDIARPDVFDFFGAFASAVSVKSGRESAKVTVCDSKKLFTGVHGFRRLEETWLSFQVARRGGCVLPALLPVFLSQACTIVNDTWDAYPWYTGRHSQADVLAAVPRAAATVRLTELASTLAEALRRADVTLTRADVFVMPVSAFNRSLTATQNKADTAFTVVGRGLHELWLAHADHGLVVRVDKQGGRSQYKAQLQVAIPGAVVNVIAENPAESRYLIEAGDRRMIVCFAMRSDALHLPVSLASVGAKYVRELLMDMQNTWFTERAPTLRPSAGYPDDAKRWIKDSAAVRAQLNLGDALLIRDR